MCTFNFLSNAILEMFCQNVNWKIEIKQSSSEALALEMSWLIVPAGSPCLMHILQD